MNEITTLLPYGISIVISIAVGVLCWQRRQTIGAREYAVVAFGSALAVVGAMGVLLSPTLEGKRLWDVAAWLMRTIPPIALLAFALAYTGRKIHRPALVFGALALVPIARAVIGLAGWSAGLLQTNLKQIEGELFAGPDSANGPMGWIVGIYTWSLLGIGLTLLVIELVRSRPIHRGRIAIIITGHLIAMIGVIVMGATGTAQTHVDTTAFTFAAANLVMVWGLFVFRLFDVRPIAGEQLIEQLNEIVIVVDTDERILVINEAARRLINKPAHEIIGRTTMDVFPANADLVKRFAGVTEFQSEIESPGANGTVYYDLNMKPLYDRSGRLIGRLAVAHDITAIKETQDELSKQQTKLKQMVTRRTAALTVSNNQLKQEIAKQEQLTLKLREQDERLRLMAEATFEGLAITEGEVLAEANEQMADMLGTRVDDLIGKSIFDYVAPELQKEAMLRIVAGEQVLHDQIAVRQDSTRLPVEVRTRLISRDGRELRLLAVRDMTEYHKAQQALRESEERFRLILENTPILLDAFDANRNIIAWNRACEEVTGYSAKEMIDNPRAMELLYPNPDYRALLWEESKDPTIHESTFDLVTKSGEVRSVNWFESYQKLAIPGWPMWGMGIDVTERERAVTALRDSEKRYRAIVEDQTEFVVRWKPDGTRTYANQAYCRFFELDYDEVVGTSFFPLIAKEAQKAVRERLDALKFGGPVSTDVHQVINPDGSRGWQEWTDRALFDENGDLIEMQSVGRDVTQRVLAEEAEREQRTLNEALVESAAALNSLLDLDKVLDMLLMNMRRTVQHDTSNVMLIEGGLAKVVRANGYPKKRDPLGNEYPLSTFSLMRQLIETQKPLYVPDTRNDPTFVRTNSSRDILSFISIPIIMKGSVIGIINLDSLTPNAFNETHVNRLMGFADQAAIAIHNARLYEAEREQRALNEALVEIAATLNSVLDLDKVLESIFSNLSRAVKHDAANVMLIENGVGRIIGANGYPDNTLPIGTEYPLTKYKRVDRLFKTGEAMIITDTHHDTLWVPSPQSKWVRSVIGMPIQLEGKVIGAIFVDNKIPNFFTEKDVARLSAFANQVAIAIHNARLYEAEHKQRRLAETLQQTASTLLRTLNTHDTLTVIMDQLAQVVGYDQAMLLSVEETALRIKADRGLPLADDRVGQLVDYASSSVVKKLLASGSPLILADVQQQADAQDYPGVAAETHAWIAIPLLAWDIVTGLLIVGSNKVGVFNEETANAANAFAQQAAIAIQNVRSMTELSDTVHRLREAQARLTGAARLAAAGEIAAGVAHQLNNPLTAVIAEVSLLLKHLPTDHTDYESALNIRTAAEKAAHIVQRQLNLSKAIPYEMEETDINKSLSESLTLVRSQIEPSAHLFADLSADLPPIMASPEHLSDVWLNLLLNARDGVAHMPDAQIRVRTRVDHKQNAIIIAVEDNGEGIPHEHLEHIFDPFFTTRSGGHGLGLPVCYEVVRRHNGTIQLDSRVGEGTNITVTLPIATGEVP